VSPENRVAFAGGLFAGIRVTPSFLIQPEVLYTQKGARYEVAGEEAVIKLDYVEVPVLLKGRFGSGGVKPSVFAGPAMAIKVSGKSEFRGEEEDAEDVKSTDFGVVFGAGLDFAVGSGAFTIDARYTLGLTTFVDVPDPDDVKNGVWTFSVGYAF
jgi:opacity protein-like surface antigen